MTVAASATATAAAAAARLAAAATTTAATAATTPISRFVLPAVPPALALLPATSVWLEFTPLAGLTTPPAINLGQGFPDWLPPPFLTRALPGPHHAHDAGKDKDEDKDNNPAMHQYARSAGHGPLVHAIARQYAPRLKPTLPPPPPPFTSSADVAADGAAGSAARAKATAAAGGISSGAAHNISNNSNSNNHHDTPTINPMTEVLVTAGASHALSLAIAALAGPGDEVVLIEPAFDVYTGAVLTAGATPVYVPMRSRPTNTTTTTTTPAAKTSADFAIDMRELAAACNHKTKLIVLNSPHNPTGKVMSAAELLDIARIVQAHPQCAVISDEVYEHMTYNDNLPHIPFASLSPDLYDRTVSIYSSGKTFSATGWKIGWAIGPPAIIKRMHALHQYSVFSIATNLQEAVAIALDRALEPYQGEETYYKWLASSYKARRDYFVRALRDAPDLEPVVPDGAFYVMARHAAASESAGEESSITDMTKSVSELPVEIAKFVEDGILSIDPDTANRKDYNFCRKLALERQVVSIPPSAFFCKEHCDTDLASNYVRLAFSKKDHVLQEARRRLCMSDKGTGMKK